MRVPLTVDTTLFIAHVFAVVMAVALAATMDTGSVAALELVRAACGLDCGRDSKSDMQLTDMLFLEMLFTGILLTDMIFTNMLSQSNTNKLHIKCSAKEYRERWSLSVNSLNYTVHALTALLAIYHNKNQALIERRNNICRKHFLRDKRGIEGISQLALLASRRCGENSRRGLTAASLIGGILTVGAAIASPHAVDALPTVAAEVLRPAGGSLLPRLAPGAGLRPLVGAVGAVGVAIAGPQLRHAHGVVALEGAAAARGGAA